VQEKTCQPPSTIYVTRGGGEDTGGVPIGVPTKGADVDGGTTISIAPSVPDGGAAQGATTPPNPTAPGAGNSGPTTETVASTSGGGGCSVGAGQGAEGSAWLVLVGLGLFLVRRGRKRTR
jgi:MYXO-CTERM domain-containing protein